MSLGGSQAAKVFGDILPNIFRKCKDEGVSLKEIKRRLDGNVLTNRGEVLWSSGSVLSLMSNTIHKGIYTVYNTQLPSPKIVDEELWERVKKFGRDFHKKKNFNSKKTAPLSPFLPKLKY